MSVSTHVLDTASGRPAAGIAVTLEQRVDDGWAERASRRTDQDGRIADLCAETAAGSYRLRFDTGGYHGPDAFFPEVTVAIRISDGNAHYHVPVLLSPFAYSTYLGS